MPVKKLYVDTETTGTDPKRHGIIQIACRTYLDREPTQEPLVLVLKPFEKDVIEDDALKVNGIERDELFKDNRLDPRDAFRLFVKYVGHDTDKYSKTDKMFFCGYRAQFDSDFIREFMMKNGDKYYGSWFWTPPLCYFMLAGYLLQKWRHRMKDFKLRTVYEFLHPEMNGKWSEEEWHDAFHDIERTIDIESRLRLVAAGKWTPENELPLE
jgi:DNA polymerase-3 subunit epsilon